MPLSAVLFDSSALRDSELLTLVHPAYRHFVGPMTVRVLRTEDSNVYQSFEKALMDRRIDNLGADASDVVPAVGASPEQADILGHASLLSKDGYERVLIVSADAVLERLARERQIACMTPVAYRADVKATTDAETAAAAKAAADAAEEARRKRAAVIRQALIGIGIAGIAVLVWHFRQRLVSTVPVWGTVLVIAVAGPLLYALRGRQRLVYGVAETAIGLYSALSTVAPFVWGHPTVPPAFGPSSGVAIAGGIYVMVRGLDNIGTSLKGTGWESRWQS